MVEATMPSDDPIRAVDLFCGAGGLSWGLVEALKEIVMDAERPTEAVLADAIDLVGVNHWKIAIQTHERNHPWARHFHDDVQNVDPGDVFDAPDPEVTILSGGIECTHWSTARGGKPVDEQKRMPAWDVLTWIQKLRPQNVLLENVREFAKWGPIENGTPTRTGETFQAWVDSIHALGYSVDWQVLNAADYGDATTRERLFVVARRDHRPEFPDTTHSEDGHGDTKEWRAAAEIIDWSDPGESIWMRDRPLVNNTMQRIAEGLRRHGPERLAPFADAIAELGKADVEALQERVVPSEYAPLVAEVLDEPFLAATPGGAAALASPHLVKYYGTATAKPVTAPVDTITAGGLKHGLCTPYLLGQHGGSRPREIGQPAMTVASSGAIQLYQPDTFVLPRNGPCRGLHSNPAYDPCDRPLHTVTAKNHDGHVVTPTLLRYSHGGARLDLDAPLPTITTAKGGVFALSQPYLVPYYGERDGQRPRSHPITEPYPTVTATGSDPYLARPFLVSYHGNDGAQSVATPLPTVTSRDRFALIVPDRWPWGLDIRFRMLQPRELAAAQGFPDDHEFAGTKTETVEQIGNAVPVNLAETLVASLLKSSRPALTDYLEGDGAVAADGGEPADAD